MKNSSGRALLSIIGGATIVFFGGKWLLSSRTAVRSDAGHIPEHLTTNVAAGSVRATPASTNQAHLSPLTQKLEAMTTDPVTRRPLVEKLAGEMSNAERLAALEELWSEEASGTRRELLGEVMRKWAEAMPQAAAEWVSKKPAGALQQEASKAVAIAWANQNHGEAAAWVRHWPDNTKESGLLAVAYETVRSSPKEALWLASELTPSPARDGLITHAVREWTAQEPDAPVAWAEKMAQSNLREQVFAGAAVSLSETDPLQAAKLVLEKVPPGGRQDDAVVSIVQRWAQTEPASAAAWVERFPEGRARESAVENLVQIWAEKDSEQTAQWLNALKDGEARDAGLSAFARRLAPVDAPAALTWVQSMSNPEIREKELEALLSTWMRTDRQAASSWMESSSLAQELKSRLLEPHR